MDASNEAGLNGLSETYRVLPVFLAEVLLFSFEFMVGILEKIMF